MLLIYIIVYDRSLIKLIIAFLNGYCFVPLFSYVRIYEHSSFIGDLKRGNSFESVFNIVSDRTRPLLRIGSS